jgi:hypothetical protein
VGIPSDEKAGCASANAYADDRGYQWYGIYLEAGTSM